MVESVVKEVMLSDYKDEKKELKTAEVLLLLWNKDTYKIAKDQIDILQNKGISYDLCFLESDKISTANISTNGNLFFGEDIKDPIIIADDYQFIVVPEIDLDNTVRLAEGMRNTTLADILYGSLIMDKYIYINKNATGIKCSDRKKIQNASLPRPLKKKFQNHLISLKNYGVDLVEFTQVADGISKTISLNNSTFIQTEEQVNNQNGFTFTQKLLTSEWIEKQDEIPHNTIYVNKKTIISPLAKDEAKERGLTITYIE